MKHYGDITGIHGWDVPIVDIVTGGSPCQDLSVAGKRAGLDGERSGLFMEQIRIIKEMREHDRKRTGRSDEFIRPRYMVWENVPGAFSSNKGEDFRCVLEETARIVQEDAVIPRLDGKQKWKHAGCILGDGWSIAWRVHDAQFWGVPQRRKRICLLADFNGHTAGDILFECFRETEHPDPLTTVTDTGEVSGSEVQPVAESMSGDSAESGEAGETASADAGTGTDETGTVMTMQAIGEYAEAGVASSLKQRDYKDATDLVVGSFYPQMKAESQCYTEDGVANTIVNGTNPCYQNGIVEYYKE